MASLVETDRAVIKKVFEREFNEMLGRKHFEIFIARNGNVQVQVHKRNCFAAKTIHCYECPAIQWNANGIELEYKLVPDSIWAGRFFSERVEEDAAEEDSESRDPPMMTEAGY